MFEQLTSPVFVVALTSGATEILKRYKAPEWVLNVFPTVLALAFGCLQLLDPSQVAVFNEIMLSNGLIGLSVTFGYKTLSGLYKKQNVKQADVYKMITKAIKSLKQS